LNLSIEGCDLVLRLQGKDASYFVRTDANAVRSNTWYHVAASFGSEGMALYLNGVLVGSNTYAGGMQGNREALVIGGSVKTHDGSSADLAKLKVTESFDGYIDEVAFFGAQLSAEELRRVREAGPTALAMPATSASAPTIANPAGRSASVVVTSQVARGGEPAAPPASRQRDAPASRHDDAIRWFDVGRTKSWSRGDAGEEQEVNRRDRERVAKIEWSAKPQASKLAAQRDWLGAFLTRCAVDPKVNNFTIRLP
jgi:hypothetical protein